MRTLSGKRSALSIVAIAAAACVATACGDNGKGGLSLEQADECNPLGGTNCMTPWPSGIYQVADPDSPTGFRNSIPLGALPKSLDGSQIDGDVVLNQRSGFSPASPILAAFPTGIDGSNLVSYSDFPASVTAASPTVLIDASTGELVEHFAELDARAADTPEKQALFIRSAAMLKFGTRYVVGLKKSLKAPGGGELPIAEGFAALRDNVATTHPLLERARDRYDDIFEKLDTVGVAKDDLVLAWDFVTVAKEEPQRDILAARERAFASIDDDSTTLGYTVTSEENPSDPLIARRIEGTFTVPNFLSQDGRFTPATEIVRDDQGLPIVVGTFEAPFVAIVPTCAEGASEPIPMVIYGHGLLGDGSQAASSGPRHLAGNECMVVLGTDFRGFSNQDITNLALVLNDFNKQATFFPVQIQGVINHLVLTRTAQGPMTTDLFVGGTPTASLVDPDQVYYYGISQGGIMGGTVMAYDPNISRAVLQVGAINYSMLLERSLDWPTYRTILIGAYPDPLDVALLINLMQEYWDMDPATTAFDVLEGTIPGTPPKQLLLQMAVADDEVSNIATEYQARTMGISTLTPSVYEPYKVPGADGPLSSALVIYDYGLGGTIPTTNEAPPDNSVHGQVRRQTAAVEQMGTFLKTGEILQFCGDSGCDCTGDGCGEQL